MIHQAWKRRSLRFLAVLCLFSFVTLTAAAVALTPSTALAAPAARKHPPHQPGTFIHLAASARPAALAASALTCSGTGCNGKSAYATDCAGQSWDSWWVVSSTPVVKSGRTVATLQLWWSDTCATNWTRLVPYVSYSSSSLLLVLQDCSPLNNCGCSAVWETCSDVEVTLMLGSSIITEQLYAPQANACSEGGLRSGSTTYGPAITGQFHAPNKPSQCFTDWQLYV